MDAFEAIADPVRRAILESLRDGPRAAGELGADFSISRPAVSRHLRVLREAGLVDAEVVGRQRVYRLAGDGLTEVDEWIGRFHAAVEPHWDRHFDALETEVRRTAREREQRAPAAATRSSDRRGRATA